MPDFVRKKIRLECFDYTESSYPYYVTINCHEKQPYFLNIELATFVQDNLEFRRAHNEIELLCSCIMPTHIHLLFYLGEEYKKGLSKWISAFKRFITKGAREKYNIRMMWQKNFYDHIVRSTESLEKIAEYILNNPVRKNIVKEWPEYPYSKFYL